MKYARIVDDVAVEVVTADPHTLFTTEIADLFVEVSDDCVYMAARQGGPWIAPPEPLATEPLEPEPASPPARILKVTPPTFLLLFTPQERIAIRAARQGENAMVKAVLDDWFSMIDDPRLTQVDLTLPATQDGLSFLVSVGLLTDERKAEIRQGFQA